MTSLESQLNALKAKYTATGTNAMETVLLTNVFAEAIDQAAAIVAADTSAQIEALRKALISLIGDEEQGDPDTPHSDPVTIRCQIGDMRRGWSALSQPKESGDE